MKKATESLLPDARRVGTIKDVLDQYDLWDAGAVWQAILHEEWVRNPETGQRVRLIAPKEEKEGDLWIVFEITAPDFRPARGEGML